MPQIHTKIDKKKLKSSDFCKFYLIFVYFSKALVAQNPTDVQQGNNSLSEGFFEEVTAICTGKMHQIHTKIDKKTKKFRFLKILFNFCVFF